GAVRVEEREQDELAALRVEADRPAALVAEREVRDRGRPIDRGAVEALLRRARERRRGRRADDDRRDGRGPGATSTMNQTPFHVPRLHRSASGPRTARPIRSRFTARPFSIPRAVPPMTREGFMKRLIVAAAVLSALAAAGQAAAANTYTVFLGEQGPPPAGTPK